MKLKTSSRSLHIASLLCVIHCVLTPFLILVAPVVGGYLENAFLEVGFLVVSIATGTFITYNGFCMHKKYQALMLFLAGAILWSAHSILEHFHTVGAEYYLVLGTLFVLSSYYLNHSFLNQCPSECCTKE